MSVSEIPHTPEERERPKAACKGLGSALDASCGGWTTWNALTSFDNVFWKGDRKATLGQIQCGRYQSKSGSEMANQLGGLVTGN
ncbi:hypothetical protein PENSUB_10829 [Penicillium subrubescens]|uniref:Uncharacterized protein n=1 Tax=Penicillium subrubescens TaxID=1316194 RepID=A0A1Q5T8V2_9EURO|nr:hypothetical protein PENSUB_10829 [Penicillium subrubescens]